MRGHVAKKGARYYAVVTVPDASGRAQKRRWSGGFERKREAERALTSMLDAMDKGVYMEASKQTLGQFLAEEWLPAIQATVKASTLDSYRRNIEGHVVPRLGGLLVSQVTPARLNAFYAEMLESGRTDGRGGLAPKTVRNLHTTIHRALRDAVRWGKLSRNAADLADPPKLRAAKPSEMNVWSVEEVRAFLNSRRHDRLYACWFLALTTGMRRGELLGLRWADVDLDTGHLSVRQILVSVAYEVSISEPKTDRSRRTLSLDPATVAVLRAYRTRQLEERMAWGPAWSDTGLVFTRENGELIHPQLLSDAFDRHLKVSKMRRIRLHDLRHTYATLALDSGMRPWDLSDRLGHSSVAFTMNVYRHAIKATQEEAATRAAAFILGTLAAAVEE